MNKKKDRKKNLNANIRKKKRMSYKKKIQTFQVGAITFAVFLTLIVGSQILTRKFVGQPDNSNISSAKKTYEVLQILEPIVYLLFD